MILTLEGGSHRIKMKFNRSKYTQQLKNKQTKNPCKYMIKGNAKMQRTV